MLDRLGGECLGTVALPAKGDPPRHTGALAMARCRVGQRRGTCRECAVIFITVGYQMAFDRLVQAVDAWKGFHSDSPAFAQIGPSDLRPAHLEFVDFTEPEDFTRLVRDNRTAHAVSEP